jgi:WD40 repeat protein
VRVFDAHTGVPLLVLRGHTERLGSVAFDHDGRELVTASWDGTVRRWGLDVLVVEPARVKAQVEQAWDLSVQDALAAPLR